MHVAQNTGSVFFCFIIVMILEMVFECCWGVKSIHRDSPPICAALEVVLFVAAKLQWLFQLWMAWEFFCLPQWLELIVKRPRIHNHFHDIDPRHFSSLSED